jgi:hypothetical protein
MMVIRSSKHVEPTYVTYHNKQTKYSVGVGLHILDLNFTLQEMYYGMTYIWIISQEDSG